MRAMEAGEKVMAMGEATPEWVIKEIKGAARLRGDLPANFHKLTVTERQTILGLDGQKKGKP